MGMHPVWFDLLYLFVIIFVINYTCDFKKKLQYISVYRFPPFYSEIIRMILKDL